MMFLQLVHDDGTFKPVTAGDIPTRSENAIEKAKRIAQEKAARGVKAGTKRVDAGKILADMGHPELIEDRRAIIEAADFLADLRVRAGLNVKEMASRLGVTSPRVCEIERGEGRQGPTWTRIKRWGKSCGVDVRLFEHAPPDFLAEPFLRTVFLRDQFGVRHLNLPYGHALGITKEPGRDTTLYFFSNALMWEKFRKDQKTELEKPSRQLTAGASYKLKSGISVFTSAIFEKPLELLAVEAGKGISAEEQVSLEREEG